MTTIETPVSSTLVTTVPDSSETGRLWFKEIVTALLALAVLVALLTTYRELATLPNPARYTGVQDGARLIEAHTGNVEKIATALLGIFAAFVGYYAGRLPAEKAAADSRALADQAQQNAAVSQNQSAAAQADANMLERKLEEELSWSYGAAELLARTATKLDPDRANELATAVDDGISARSLAAEVVRYVNRRHRNH